MKEKLKIIISFCLLWLFLFPTVVKVEHHHHEFSCNAHGEQHLHSYHEKCDICSFEFPFFENLPGSTGLQIEQIIVDFYNKHNSPNYFAPQRYSFLLRAPPFRQV